MVKVIQSKDEKSAAADAVQRANKSTSKARAKKAEPIEISAKAKKKTTVASESDSKKRPTYKKTGQTKPTPDERDPLCIFYTSLLKQNPKSRMALVWCLERGLLSTKKANDAILMLEMEKLKVKI